MRYTSAAISEQGDRMNNQDVYRILEQEDGIHLLLADGVGGETGGRFAAENAVEILSHISFAENLPDREEVEAIYELASQKLHALSKDQGGMKTTMVQLIVHGNRAVWFYMGDSRLYHWHDGELRHVTLDHSMAQMAVFFGEIRRSEIPSYPRRSVLTRSLGNEQDGPDIEEEITLEPGKHTFLLCSDGFWERMDEEKVKFSLIAENADTFLNEVSRSLTVPVSGEADNYTALALMVWI